MTASLRVLLILAGMAILALSSVASANGGEASPPDDQVVLRLEVEAWVESDTALVFVSVSAVLQGSDAGSVRAEMLAAVDTLNPTADWRFIGFDQFPDPSGLERWQGRLQARVPTDALGGLADRAEAASRPGLGLQVDHIGFSPGFADVEATKGTLRAALYAKVAEELARLDGAFPDRGYRVAAIDFLGGPVARPLRPTAVAAQREASGGQAFATADAVPGVALSRKLSMSATVVFAARPE